MKTIGQIRIDISHGCDGPITAFVLISRATEIKDADPETIANALYEELLSYGYIVDPES